MIDQTELINLLITAINASVRAGKLILDVYNSNEFQVNLKSDKTPLTLDSIRRNYPERANKIDFTTQWLLSLPWSDEIQFIILYGSVSEGYARYNSDIDLVIGITANPEQLTAIRKN